MTIQAIPTTGTDSFWTQTTTLDGIPYLLSFAYNQRANCWYLSIATIEGVDILNGAKLLVGWDMTGKTADPNWSGGIIFVWSNTTDQSPPGQNDLQPSGRCVLCYMPAADVTAAGLGR